MENFVTKGLNISRLKLYQHSSIGGLGMFELKKFITGLQISWINMAHKATNDNWKIALKKLGNGTVLHCHECSVDELNTHGIAIKNIVESYRIFIKCYYLYGNNFLLDSVFNNQRYGTDRQNRTLFNDEYLETVMNDFTAGRVWSNLLVNGNFVSYEEFEHLTEIRVPRAKYTAIKNCYYNLYKKCHLDGKPPMTLLDFFNKIKKGSKQYRKILCFKNIDDASILKEVSVTFYHVYLTNVLINDTHLCN